MKWNELDRFIITLLYMKSPPAALFLHRLIHYVHSTIYHHVYGKSRVIPSHLWWKSHSHRGQGKALQRSIGSLRNYQRLNALGTCSKISPPAKEIAINLEQKIQLNRFYQVPTISAVILANPRVAAAPGIAT